MKTRAHVIVDEGILKEIDCLVGKNKRSSFIAEAAKKELQRLNQLSLLRKLKGA
jgi:metal-responsive CopG/Arc/MetJ family transcriptional regulator